jgi:hypothetical protein
VVINGHAINFDEEDVEAKFHPFLTSVLEVGQWSVSHLDPFVAGTEQQTALSHRR